MRYTIIEDDKGYRKDTVSGAVLATREAYERWKASAGPKNEVIDLRKRVEQLGAKLERLESVIERLIDGLD